MRTITIFLFFTFTIFASAQEVLINGFATLAADSKVYAYEVSDEITNQNSLIAQTVGDENGRFNLKVPVKRTMPLVICTGHARTRIWVDPGQKYTITFLNPDSTITQNGLVQFWEARIECESNVATDALIGLINNKIAEFISNNTYDYLLLQSNTNKTAVKRIRNKNPGSDLVKFSEPQDSTIRAQSKFYESLALFEASITNEFKSILEKNAFIENYLFCKLSQLKLLTMVSDSYKEMYTRIDISNPAFCEWLGNFANNYLSSNLKVQEKLKFDSLLQSCTKPEEVIKFINRDNSYNLELEELILVTALRNKYYSSEWSSQFVARLNNLVYNNSNFETSKALSKNLARELSRQVQTEISDFTLIDDKGEKWIFSEQCDRNMYLYFFNSNKASQRDLALLNQLASKYKYDFRIIAIGMQGNYEDYTKALQPMKLTNLTTLYGGNDYQIIDNLRIQSVPFAIETNNKMKIAFKYTPLPSEGIQVKWEEILRKNKK